MTRLYNHENKQDRELVSALLRQAVDEAPNPYDARPPAMGKIIERFNQLLTANGIDPQTGEIIEQEKAQ